MKCFDCGKRRDDVQYDDKTGLFICADCYMRYRPAPKPPEPGAVGLGTWMQRR